MRRREFFLSWLCLSAFAADAGAQRPGKPAKLAILSPDVPASADPGTQLGIFLQAMRELGYVEGRSIQLEFRFAENRLDRLPALAAELVNWRPDVIYTYTAAGAEAAAGATKSIPIVVGPAGEPILAALAGNYARPVGNVTGLTLTGPELEEKCLQLLKELAPRVMRVGVLLNPDGPQWRDYPAILGVAADRLGLTLVRGESRGPTDIERSLARLDSEKLDALLLLNDSTLVGNVAARARIIEFARDRRLPSASTLNDYARSGGLLSLGTDMKFIRWRAAEYVHRIIEGARPGDLPVERPTKFQLSVNLDTAKTLGLTVPQTILGRADEVIE